MAILKKPSFDPGFTQKYYGELRRILNPNGQFNVRRRGTGWRDFHPYLFMINTSWTVFFALILSGFVVANVVFAFIYLKLGIENLQGADTATPFTRFMSAFFFSAQTFTTVGYGHISPSGIATNLLASIQALLGFMALAIGTGVLFGRFSRPVARVAFSDRMVVAPYQSDMSLQFRIANRRSNNLLEVVATVILSTVEPSGDTLVRKYTYLALERDVVQFLPLTWTVVHVIDENSPLWGKGPDDLAQKKVEFLVDIKGFDDTFFQTVHARHSYRHDEVVWGARFSPAFEPDAQGAMVLDLQKLSEISRITS